MSAQFVGAAARRALRIVLLGTAPVLSNYSFSEPISLTGGTPVIEGLFQPMHLIIIGGIALLIFGPKKLPELGKGMGEGIRGFKAAMQAKEDSPASAPTPTAS